MIRALLGGSFDPIHAGHVAMVDWILGDGLADHVHLVVAARSPHKTSTAEPGRVRLRLARAAVAGRAGCGVEDLEIRRGGPSYTLDTLRTLAERHPGDRWRLAIGSDNLDDLDRWHRPREVLALAELLVLARGDWDGTLPPLARGRAVTVTDFDVPVSSTAVREALRAGRVPRDLLPGVVADLIEAEGLYGPDVLRDDRPGRDAP